MPTNPTEQTCCGVHVGELSLVARRMRRHLVYFANWHVEFRLPELESLCLLYGAGLRYDAADYSDEHPFLSVDFDNPSAIPLVLSRAILIKSIYELWGHGATLAEVHDAVRAYPDELKLPHTKAQTSFKVVIESYGKKSTLRRNLGLIESFAFLDFDGPIVLANPDRVFVLLEYFGNDSTNIPDEPVVLYFGRFLGESRRGDTLDAYSLKKRRFIATTSMDAELSFIMSNMAMCRPGSFVFDPFVGTGSLLVPCAVHGAMVLGSDINPLVLRGKGIASSDVWMRDNFVQYGILDRFVGILASDNAHLPWRADEYFHAIVADPPYGIREGARKIGVKDGKDLKQIPEHLRASHIPQSKPYELVDVLGDLLDFAAKFLCMGGRLVYWMPCFRPEYNPSHVPTHPCFRLVANSEQRLAGYVLSRRLITVEKIAPYKAHPLADDVALATALGNLRQKVMTCNDDERPPEKNARREKRTGATQKWKAENPEEYERQMEFRRATTAAGIARRVERERMRARGELTGKGHPKEITARMAASGESSPASRASAEGTPSGSATPVPQDGSQ